MRTAIGGVFLATADPQRLMDWFETLGLAMERHGSGGWAKIEEAGSYSAIGVMQARPETPRLPDAPVEREPYGRQSMMLNLRVSDVGAAVERLRAAGTEVVGPETYEGQGRFAWTRTPDGHDVELWEPRAGQEEEG